MSDSNNETTGAIERPSWSRPPFEPRNTAALASGYRSPRRIAELAADIRAEMIAADPHLENPRHRFAVDAAAWSQAEVWLLRQHVSVRGMFDGNGNPRQSLLDRLRTSESKAARALAALGLDPTSEARLRRDQSAAVAFSAPELLAQRMAEGRAALDARAATLPQELTSALDREAETGNDDGEDN
jgi:hypothetical protein